MTCEWRPSDWDCILDTEATYCLIQEFSEGLVTIIMDIYGLLFHFVWCGVFGGERNSGCVEDSESSTWSQVILF